MSIENLRFLWRNNGTHVVAPRAEVEAALAEYDAVRAALEQVERERDSAEAKLKTALELLTQQEGENPNG